MNYQGQFPPLISSSHPSNHQNYEEQHDEDHEERQKDANSLEHQDTIVIQADEVAEAPSLSVPTPDDDESAFVEMGIQFVDALRKNDWKLVDDLELKLDEYLEKNTFSRSQKAQLWSLLTSKL